MGELRQLQPEPHLGLQGRLGWGLIMSLNVRVDHHGSHDRIH